MEPEEVREIAREIASEYLGRVSVRIWELERGAQGEEARWALSMTGNAIDDVLTELRREAGFR